LTWDFSLRVGLPILVGILNSSVPAYSIDYRRTAVTIPREPCECHSSVCLPPRPSSAAACETSKPANTASARTMTVTNGRAGHFRTVSAVSVRQRGSIYSLARLPPRRAERAPPPPLRLSNSGPTSCGLRPRRQPTIETTTALARLDPHATRFALAVARPTYRPLLSGQRHPIAVQAERVQLAAINAHPAAMIGTGTPTLRGRTCNEAIVMPTAPSLERDSATGRRTSGN
jgi:hypothetical protein